MIWKDRFGGLPPSRKEIERDINEELDLHLEMRAKDFEREGLDPDSAKKKAQRRFGDAERYAKETLQIKNDLVNRQERHCYWDEIRQDVFFGLRQLAKKPALPLVIVVLVAVGLGANTAIFSVVKAVMLEPLPFESPDQLVMIWDTKQRHQVPVSYLNFQDWRATNESFDDIGVFDYTSFNLAGQGEPERLAGSMVSSGLFEILRVQPVLGRTLLPEEDRPGARPVVLISYRLWQRRFGADPDIVGKSIRLDGGPFTVIGVMPAGFQIPSPWTRGEDKDLWVSHHIPEVNKPLLANRGSHLLLCLARLKAGVSIEEAQEEMDFIARRLEQHYPDTNKETGARVTPLVEELLGKTSRQLMMLLGAAGLVLLVVCGNVAGLLMAKATTRQSEIAVRSALGASRARLIRQLLVENLPLALLGGTFGLLLAHWGLFALRAILPTNIPRIETVTIDGWVFAFTLGLSILTGVLFSIAPAWVTARAELTSSLKEGRGFRPGSAGPARARSILVVTQFALTLLLAHAAALMLQSYFELRGRDYGFNVDDVLIVGLTIKGSEYDSQSKFVGFYNDVIERIESLPGIRHVALTNKLPLEGGSNARIKDADGHDFSGTNRPSVETSIVTMDYFKAMGIPMLEGRTFDVQDRSINSWSIVINETLADTLWPGESSIGKHFTFPFYTPVDCRVVGVVGDVRQHSPEKDPVSEVYLNFTPLPSDVERYLKYVKYLVVETDGDPLTYVGAIRHEVAKVDPHQPISGIRTTAGIVGSALARRRFNTFLIGLFAVTALMLLAAGIYGITAFFVVQRTHEIGIRVAMGASRSGVQKLVLGQGLKLAVIGVVVGLVGVFTTTKLTESMVYGLSPTDPATLMGGVVFLVSLGFFGSLLPALRASRVDPILALRDE
jgi:putative ABC transport system permease protein